MNWINHWPFYWQIAFWMIMIGAVVNSACAILGTFLVLRRNSMLGDAISHSVLPGVVLGFIFAGTLSGGAMLLGAIIAAILTAFFTQTLHWLGKVSQDAAMGIIFTAFFALGVILLANIHTRVDLDLECVLFGKIEYQATLALPAYRAEPYVLFGWQLPSWFATFNTIGPAFLATLLFTFLFWKELKITSFDPNFATAIGFRSQLMHYLLMAMVALVVVTALEAVGAILVVAMLIVPAATAYLLTDKLRTMMMFSVILGILAAILGCAGTTYLEVSWGLKTSGAGMMAISAGSLLLLAILIAPRHGLISKAWNRWQLSMRIICEDIIAYMYRTLEKANGSAEQRTFSSQECSQAKTSSWKVYWALRRLRKQEYIAANSAGTFTLTEKGCRLAQSLVRAHRLWEAYLEHYFDLPLDHLHEPAEQIEHYLGPDLQEALSSELQQPALDPHGRPIPSLPKES